MFKVNLSTPFILTTSLGGRFSYYPHCTEEEAEPLRGYYFPRPHWYRVSGFESILWLFFFLCLAMPCSMQDLSSPIRAGTHAAQWVWKHRLCGSTVLTTGLPGKSPNLHFKELDCPS